MRRVFLDNNSTTPVDPRVLDKMLPYLKGEFGNAASNHPYGWSALTAVEEARTSIANILGVLKSKEIIFTSGATEANNTAILGLAYKIKKQHPKLKAHFITSKAEHSSVLGPFEVIEKDFAYDVTYVEVNEFGQVEVGQVEKYIRPETVLMSFIWGNNEIGSINPMRLLSELAHKNNILFHTDATQAFGKISEVNLNSVKFDMLSLSGHKIYGPKGVGALYVGSKVKDSVGGGLHPLLWGGGHEDGMRAGTLNVPGIVGLGEACRLINYSECEDIKLKAKYFLMELQNYFQIINSTSLNKLPSKEIKLNGHPVDRLPGQLNLQFINTRMDQLIHQMASIAVSTTSACGSGGVSHVLKAIGLSLNEIHSSVRIGIGRFTTKDDLDFALQTFKNILK